MLSRLYILYQYISELCETKPRQNTQEHAVVNRLKLSMQTCLFLE